MKVTFVLDSLGAGGTERSTALLLPLLQDRGVDVDAIVLRSSAEGSEGAVMGLGIPVLVLNSGSYVARARELRAHLRSRRPDVLHSAIYAADQVSRIASLGLDLKVVSSLVSVPRVRRFRSESDPARRKVHLVNALDALTGHLLVDRFHAVSPGVAKAYSAAYRLAPSKVTVVERGRSLEELGIRTTERTKQVRESLGVNQASRLVIAAGRHEFHKAHVDLVRAMSIVAKTHPDAVLLIAGRNGNATQQLTRAIEGIEDGERLVRLLGHRSDVADLLAASDVMALSSILEGTAGIALEAMGVGTPVVSTRLEGMAGILEHERNALIVEPRDPVQMAAAICRILDEPELGQRLARGARADFLDRFTLERSADRMLELYRDVVGDSSRSRK